MTTKQHPLLEVQAWIHTWLGCFRD